MCSGGTLNSKVTIYAYPNYAVVIDNHLHNILKTSLKPDGIVQERSPRVREVILFDSLTATTQHVSSRVTGQLGLITW